MNDRPSTIKQSSGSYIELPLPIFKKVFNQRVIEKVQIVFTQLLYCAVVSMGAWCLPGRFMAGFPGLLLGAAALCVYLFPCFGSIHPKDWHSVVLDEARVKLPHRLAHRFQRSSWSWAMSVPFAIILMLWAAYLLTGWMSVAVLIPGLVILFLLPLICDSDKVFEECVNNKQLIATVPTPSNPALISEGDNECIRDSEANA